MKENTNNPNSLFDLIFANTQKPTETDELDVILKRLRDSIDRYLGTNNRIEENKMEEHKISLYGKEYILVGSKTEGAIATREQFENFLPGYAHLMENGDIMRFGNVIGTVDDITYLEGE